MKKKKKNAIKYVIQIGKNKRIPNTSNSYDLEPNYNSESPRRGKGYPKGFTNSYKNSPSRNTQDDQNPGMNKYISISDYTNLDSNPKKNYRPIRDTTSKSFVGQPHYVNTEESQNDNEVSSINDEEREGGYPRRKKPDPRIMNRINRVLRDGYEKAERKTNNERRNRNIPAMPRIRKNSNKYNNNDEEGVEDLISTIEELQDMNKNLKRDNDNKNKEINKLKNELDSMQKEMDEKRT